MAAARGRKGEHLQGWREPEIGTPYLAAPALLPRLATSTSWLTTAPGAADARPQTGGGGAGQVGIAMHDHIVVGKNRHTSFRGLKLP